MDETNELRGQHALVTGGGRGIGRGIAQRLAAAGAAVAVLARGAVELAETRRLIEASGGRCLALPADVTDRAAVEVAVARAEAEPGPLDLLVNGAGSHLAVGELWEVNADAWWTDIASNLRGPFLRCRAVLPGMIARRRGRIITIASGAALEPRPYSTAYAAAKAAVLRLTDSLHAAVQGHGVSIFAIHPGGVHTALTERILASEAGRSAYPHWQTLDWQPPERAAALVMAIAVGRADALGGRYLDAVDDLDTLIARAPEILRDDLYTLRMGRLGEQGAAFRVQGVGKDIGPGVVERGTSCNRRSPVRSGAYAGDVVSRSTCRPSRPRQRWLANGTERGAMRRLQRRWPARLAMSFAAGVAVTLLAWHSGRAVMALLLVLALVAISFVLLTIAPDAIALQRRHYWRWWWRAADDDGPFWPGTRIPRRPR
jgi:NAD(P)-dependent dehydrogenase (short-subunit alcohol dehydrogenase family)